MKKFLALMITVAMVMALAISAQAATITINRDSSWDENGEAANATYTYYQIFDAAIDTAADVDPDTGELDPNDGVVVYTISGEDAADKVAALPDIFVAKLAADGKYYITLADNSTTAATIASALATMVAANTTLFPGTAVTSSANPVEITGLADGYYLIEASNGQNLVVQTIGDVEINEKNDYPTVDKEQKKAADPDYTEAVIPAEIGTYVDYEITVHVPANANKPIYVFDNMSVGLEYDATTGLTLNPDVAYTAVPSTNEFYDANADWQIMFSAETVIANQGNDIVITYRALITEDALVDTGRENEVTLVYDEGNYVLKDKTEYTTYFGGIEKVDGSDADIKLEGVTFSVTVGGADFNVEPVLDTDGETVLYYIPGGSSNIVTTGADGLVIIRGLDNDKTYTLTEESTLSEYNLLETPVDLTLEEDTGTAYSTANYDQVQNNKGIQLPSTGGIGTTIFYVIGGMMAAFAGVMLITKKRMSQEG